MFDSLIKAVIGVVVELPVAIAADVITLGGSLTEENKSYSENAADKIVRNVQDATDA